MGIISNKILIQHQMKKLLLLCLTLNFISCNDSGSNDNVSQPIDSIKDYPDPPPKAEIKEITTSDIVLQVYSNKRFKDVTVKKTGENEYTIEGKGQIFEASFNYVVEDGHEEIKKGFQTTDAGAPAWGKFKFSIDVPKKRENSTLTLILFEISANDGSRQHELPIPLPDK